MLYTVGIALSLATFMHVPASLPLLQWANVFAIGFCLYGPQMLIGLCGAELVGPDSVGASEGFLGASPALFFCAFLFLFCFFVCFLPRAAAHRALAPLACWPPHARRGSARRRAPPRASLHTRCLPPHTHQKRKP